MVYLLMIIEPREDREGHALYDEMVRLGEGFAAYS